MKVPRAILLLLILASCAPIRVNYDFEKNIDFRKYKTYNYYSDLETGFSELDTNRFLNALDDALKTKGYILSEDPDFFINIQSAEIESINRNSVGIGVGGSGRNVGGGVSIGLPLANSNINRQIILDFHDENGIGLFWQAVAECSFNINATPLKREERFKAITEKMVSKFPPQ